MLWLHMVASPLPLLCPLPYQCCCLAATLHCLLLAAMRLCLDAPPIVWWLGLHLLCNLATTLNRWLVAWGLVANPIAWWLQLPLLCPLPCQCCLATTLHCLLLAAMRL